VENCSALARKRKVWWADGTQIIRDKKIEEEVCFLAVALTDTRGHFEI
jgi:hypothetical protein